MLKELKDLNFLDANRVLSSQNVSVLFLKQTKRELVLGLFTSNQPHSREREKDIMSHIYYTDVNVEKEREGNQVRQLKFHARD